MRTQTITNRIDNNILSLLNAFSIKDCIRQLHEITERFQIRLQENEQVNNTRSQYIKIYITHTNKRIKELNKMKLNREFQHTLFKERLQNEQFKPNHYSPKYRELLKLLN